MKILFLTHPNFFHSQSMPRFANMLADGMKKRGHAVEIFSPSPYFFRIPFPAALKKWLGYVDQYIIFPNQLRKLIRRENDLLIVFTDHALGPWVPVVSKLPHVIHCHDFLAQHSALGKIKENPTSISGRLYQAYIRKGFSKGKNFISVSQRTQQDLHQFLSHAPIFSKVVYNGLNQVFLSHNPTEARLLFGQRIGLDLTEGYILHVGGGTWYKNRPGVIELYEAYRSQNAGRVPLLFVGDPPEGEVLRKYHASQFRNDIHFFQGIEDRSLQHAYSGASVFLFPSLAEGFGWPIAEAMACGCPVVTTNEAPMTEVGGSAAFFIEKRPADKLKIADWVRESVEVVIGVLKLSETERERIKKEGIENVKRFNSDLALNEIESIYKQILQRVQSPEAVSAGKRENVGNEKFSERTS